MTRASQNTACIMAKASASRKSTSAGNYPQWMKTLEEKYQKLHKKITENTGIGHHRFSHQVGRSVYDCRLSHAIQKYREISAVKQNVIANSNPANGDKQMTDCVINTAETSVSAQKQHSKQTEPNKLPYGDNVNNLSHKEMKNDYSVSEGAELRIGNNGDSGEHADTLDRDSCADEDSEDELDEALLYKSSDRVESAEETINDTKVDFVENTDFNENVHKHVTKGSTHSRNVKTSLSRTSKVTSKSCPAKIQSRAVVHSRQPAKTLLARSKSAHRSMYIQMSEEAKHAITETIHEMNLNGPTKQKTEGEIKFFPTRNRKTIKTWAAPKKSKTDNRYDSLKVIESATKKLERLSDEVDIEKDVDEESCRSFAGSSSRESARLPEIQTDSAKETSGKNNSLRLPGIGKYDIRETFEITPPGFDSRYDLEPVEERESETPPPDIRQRAIDKCSEWLIKYGK